MAVATSRVFWTRERNQSSIVGTLFGVALETAHDNRLFDDRGHASQSMRVDKTGRNAGSDEKEDGKLNPAFSLYVCRAGFTDFLLFINHSLFSPSLPHSPTYQFLSNHVDSLSLVLEVEQGYR